MKIMAPFTNAVWLAYSANERLRFLEGATCMVRGRSYPSPAVIIQTTDGVVIGRVDG